MDQQGFEQSLQQEQMLYGICDRIRQSLELQDIVSTAVEEIRAFLKIDRVKIYHFESDGSGAVIAESIADQRLPSLLGLHFPASDIPDSAYELFLKVRQRVIINVATQHKISSQLDDSATREPLTVEDVRYAPVDPCHIQYMLGMGVMASLTVPILHQNHLWGLLVVHHTEPYSFSERELQIVQMLVDQVSIAIAQSNLLKQVQPQAHYELTVNRISSLLYNPLDLAEIQQTVLEETVKALGGSGGRLYFAAEPVSSAAQLYTIGVQPTHARLEESEGWKALMNWSAEPSSAKPTYEEVITAWEQAGRALIPSHTVHQHGSTANGIPSPYVLDLAQAVLQDELAEAFTETLIRTALIVPLQCQHQCVGWLTIFRNGYDTEILWAGRCHPDERNQLPRRSFEAWREVKTKQSPLWQQNEIKLAQTLGIHLYMAAMRKRVEALLRHEASHDRLTELPNRLLFDEQLSLALLHAQQQGEMLAVAFLDLDRFKIVNDTLGHVVGDQLLKQVTQRLQAGLRKGDIVARWGGDEFTLLFPDIAYVEDISKMAHRILEVLKAPFFLEQQELYISGSLGIALFPYDGENAATLLKNSDTAMYRAKQQGRNNYQFYSPEMNTTAREQLELETDLRKALTKDELLLYYQPQVDINTGEIIGLEALLRWQHPQIGVIPPNQFIPLAEETGLICPIGEWVIRTACEQHQAWYAAGLPLMRIAVNLSARQFQQRDLVKTIVQILQETQTQPCYLELEITESIAMQDVEFTVAVLQELRQMGIQIAMDDFGTGYSSLNSIKHFPPHTLKIDQSFVRDLLIDPSDAAIARAVIALGQGLHLKVLAEGVETVEQLEFLRTLGCQSAQGYLFSKPLPPVAITQLLREKTIPIQLESSTRPKEGQSAVAIALADVVHSAIAESIEQPLDMMVRQTQTLELTIRDQEQQIAKQKQIKEALGLQVQQEKLASKIAEQLSRLRQVEEILNFTVAQAHQLLQVDRLIVYRFDPNWRGTVVAEAVTEPWSSLLGLAIDDCCFQEQYVQYYREGRTRTVDDIYEGMLAPCHIDLLARFEVRSNMVVPILQCETLWGLLIAHQCQQPRHWQQTELVLLNRLAVQLGVAIERAELYQQLHQQPHQQP
ncbi:MULTISPECIES: EAL domain-containing protein [Trichocoleus]|uniref:EAL domain-containing protein n=1 Tax=Trichocoleus desertorum GB2-A4 TaxID=2933944 RepID=A0ABV0JCI9_9CYAN|nr:EAL domain-containing protein [Trichocoleus sp. FACHB-46]MBD1864146.1 EAL domain-containing protein [Trichocoleus sp. FACHB-46]